MATDDIRERLRRELGSGASGEGSRALPSGAEVRRSLEDLAAQRQAQKDAPLYVFIAYDVTGSMEPYIEVVKNNIREVGRELYNKETGINVAIWGVGDHSDGQLWLQRNDFTSNNQTLDGQIRRITLTHGGDAPEAYECGFSELAKAASKVKAEHPNSKVVAIFIGDSVPHGMEGFREGYRNIRDDGCPRQVDYRQSLAHLKAATDIFYFVGCNKDQIMTGLQQKLINPQRPAEKFIPLGNMVGDLPQLLIAAIKQTRDPASMMNYLKQLGGPQANRIAGYLAPPK
mgnify:CR=1 FL=1